MFLEIKDKIMEKGNNAVTALIVTALYTGLALASQHQSPSDFIAGKVAAYDSRMTLTVAQTKAKHKKIEMAYNTLDLYDGRYVEHDIAATRAAGKEVKLWK